jgi:hypothetical protein
LPCLAKKSLGNLHARNKPVVTCRGTSFPNPSANLVGVGRRQRHSLSFRACHALGRRLRVPAYRGRKEKTWIIPSSAGSIC